MGTWHLHFLREGRRLLCRCEIFSGGRGSGEADMLLHPRCTASGHFVDVQGSAWVPSPIGGCSATISVDIHQGVPWISVVSHCPGFGYLQIRTRLASPESGLPAAPR